MLEYKAEAMEYPDLPSIDAFRIIGEARSESDMHFEKKYLHNFSATERTRTTMRGPFRT